MEFYHWATSPTQKLIITETGVGIYFKTNVRRKILFNIMDSLLTWTSFYSLINRILVKLPILRLYIRQPRQPGPDYSLLQITKQTKQKKEEEEESKRWGKKMRKWGKEGWQGRGQHFWGLPSFAKTDNLGLAEQEEGWWLLPPPDSAGWWGKWVNSCLAELMMLYFGALWTGQAKLVFLLGANMCASKMVPISGSPLKHPYAW